MKFIRNEKAVSEVIGTMLMVTVVVLLAGIVAAFLFGFVENPSTHEAKKVSGTAQKLDANTIVVTYSGGKDSGTVETITWRITPDSGTDDPPYIMGIPGTILNVGTSHSITSLTLRGYSKKSHVRATAHFSDSSPDQVILDIML